MYAEFTVSLFLQKTLYILTGLGFMVNNVSIDTFSVSYSNEKEFLYLGFPSPKITLYQIST